LVLELCAAIPRRVRPDEGDQLHDVTALDPHLTIHEGLGSAKPRVEDDPAHALATGEADRHIGIARRGGSKIFLTAVRVYDGKPALAHDAREKGSENGHRERPPSSCSDPRIPFIVHAIFPVTPFSCPDILKACNRFDRAQIFGVLVTQLALDAE